MATKDDMDQSAADYAGRFNEDDQPAAEQSEDDAFGLGAPAAETPAAEAAEPPAEEAAETPAAEAAEPAAEESAEPAAEGAAPAADPEQRLKSWEGRLKAKQAELDAREAAIGTSNVGEEQASLPMDEESAEHEGTESPAEEAAEESDPGKVLAEDFGPDFVDQITRLVSKIVQDGVGGVSSTVDQVIADLQNERQQNHFNAIADTHADFMDVVESPDFAAWKAAQPDQAALQQVIDAGSAKQIIAMLSAFKQSKSGDMASADDELDAAEGVRSGGVQLPKEPTASNDFAAAWNEA